MKTSLSREIVKLEQNQASRSIIHGDYPKDIEVNYKLNQ